MAIWSQLSGVCRQVWQSVATFNPVPVNCFYHTQLETFCRNGTNCFINVYFATFCTLLDLPEIPSYVHHESQSAATSTDDHWPVSFLPAVMNRHSSQRRNHLLVWRNTALTLLIADLFSFICLQLYWQLELTCGPNGSEWSTMCWRQCRWQLSAPDQIGNKWERGKK